MSLFSFQYEDHLESSRLTTRFLQEEHITAWAEYFESPEAARLFMNYAKVYLMAESVISIIHVHNLRSQRVAEKNGLIRENQTKWRDLDVFIYRQRFIPNT